MCLPSQDQVSQFPAWMGRGSQGPIPNCRAVGIDGSGREGGSIFFRGIALSGLPMLVDRPISTDAQP